MVNNVHERKLTEAKKSFLYGKMIEDKIIENFKMNENSTNKKIINKLYKIVTNQEVIFFIKLVFIVIFILALLFVGADYYVKFVIQK